MDKAVAPPTPDRAESNDPSDTSNDATDPLQRLRHELRRPPVAGSIEEPARWGGIGGIGPVFVGSPATVADQLQDWVEATDVDGFNLAYAVTPESFEDAVDLLVPELKRRGAYPTTYRPGTLRDRLFGRGPRLPETHPAHRYRDIEAVKRAAIRADAAE